MNFEPMKATSKYQQKVFELSKKLPEITEKQKEWGITHCFEKVGYASKDSVWCLECGKVFDRKVSPLLITIVGDEAVCPHCGKKLKLENSKKRKFDESWYYTILTTFRGFQVCRHFIVRKQMWKVGNNIKDCEKPEFTVNEAVQNWIGEDGKETIIARPCRMIPHVYDAWDFSKPMSIKKRNNARYSYNPDKYDIESYFVYPVRRVLPIIKRNGYTGRFHGFSASELFRMILRDKEGEALLKNRQFDILRYKWKHNSPEFGLPFQHSIRIACRNRYIVKDASMWFDYLELLDYFHRDTHNAHYVCPSDLKAVHDKLLAKKQRIEERLEAERKKEEARKWEQEYIAKKGKYFGICFGNEDIVITVIRSVAEMAEEGEKMHHCVFSMGYYKKDNSLILSAKNRNGERIETIELNLKTFKVVQSRGVCNSNTEYHDTILGLVNKNINLIKQAA